MQRNIIGVDYSLNSPAACVISNLEKPLESALFFGFAQAKKHLKKKYPSFIIKPTRDLSGISRIISNSDLVLDAVHHSICATGLLPKVFIEGYSFNSVSSSFSEIAENCGVLKFRLLEKYNITAESIPPTTIKKFATGKGNAKKWQMWDAWLKEGGEDIRTLLEVENVESNPLSDLVDSYFIAKCGASLK